jgi:uncharacterized repeat protein (TIGR02543 family)
LKYAPVTGTQVTKSSAIPTKHHYDFKGWALDASATADEVIVDQYPEIGKDPEGNPVLDTSRTRWIDLIFNDNNNVYTLYAIFEPTK